MIGANPIHDLMLSWVGYEQLYLDLADCLAVSPLGKLTIERAMNVWRGRITVWGGMPSPLLEARVSDVEFDAHLSRLAQAAEAGGFILGISDQAMPASLWSRLGAMGRFGGR